MVIWIILLAMTAAAVMAVLWPLSRHAVVAEQADPNTQFYREQLAEIERDRQRGALLPDGSRGCPCGSRPTAPAGDQSAGEPLVAVGEPALRRRRAASTLALSVVPILALAVYGALRLAAHLRSSKLPRRHAGSDKSISARPSARSRHIWPRTRRTVVAGRSIAPVYLRMGRMDDAVKAYESALRFLGPDADRLANYGEALVIAKDGLVSRGRSGGFRAGDPARCRLVPRRASISPAPPNRMDGRQGEGTTRSSCRLAERRPLGAAVREQIARLVRRRGSPPGPPDGRGDRRHGGGPRRAVSKRQGGTRRRMGAADPLLSVLGQRDKARATAAKRARQALAQDDAGLQTIDTMPRAN